MCKMNKRLIRFIVCLLYANYCDNSFAYITSFNFCFTLQRLYHDYSSFKDEKFKAKREQPGGFQVIQQRSWDLHSNNSLL